MTGIRAWRAPLIVGVCAFLSCAGGKKPTEDLAAGRQNDAVRTRMATVLMAEDQRVADPALMSAIEDQEEIVRALAARALGRIGVADSRDSLVQALEDRSARVRAEAAMALGLLGDPSSATAVAGLVGDRDPAVRAHVATALGLLEGPVSRDALGQLLGDDRQEVVVRAAGAASTLSDIGPLVDPMIALSASEIAPVAVAADTTLASWSRRPSLSDYTTRGKIRGRMLELASSPIAERRAIAARGLFVPRGTREIETLAMLSEDDAAPVRIEAVRSFSFPGAPFEPILSRTILDEDLLVKTATVLAMRHIVVREAIEALAGVIIHDPHLWLRVAAVSSANLADTDSAAGMANGISRDPAPELRAISATTLYGRRDEPALDNAARLADDPVSLVRVAGIPALAGADEMLSDLLAEAIGDEDPRILAAAARAAGTRLEFKDLTEAQVDDAVKVLRTLWDGAAAESEYRIQTAVLEAAGAAPGHEDARELIRDGLRQSDRRIRRRAMRLMREVLDEDPPDLAGPASDRSLDEYREILDWASRPRAAVVTVERPGFLPGRFTVRLDTRRAPLTSWHFKKLAESGYYSGQPFRRLLPNRLIETANPEQEGLADLGHAIRDEFHAGDLHAGTLVMSWPGPDRAEGQWLILLGPSPAQVGRRTAFGQVVQNLTGVVARILPEDRIVSIRVYEGDGTEPLAQQ